MNYWLPWWRARFVFPTEASPDTCKRSIETAIPTTWASGSRLRRLPGWQKALKQSGGDYEVHVARQIGGSLNAVVTISSSAEATVAVEFNHNDQAGAYIGVLAPVFLIGLLFGNPVLVFPLLLFGAFAGLGFALMKQAAGDVAFVLDMLRDVLKSDARAQP